jgi:hypothetical protein
VERLAVPKLKAENENLTNSATSRSGRINRANNPQFDLSFISAETHPWSWSEEAVVVEHEAAGGVGAEQLVVRRPRLRTEPHPPERLQDLAPVHAPSDHHLLDARLHLNPLNACDF